MDYNNNNPFNNFNNNFNNNNKKVINISNDKALQFLKTGGFVILGIVLVLMIFNSITFTVGEREQVVITQFDKIVRMVIEEGNESALASAKNDPKLVGIRIDSGKGLFLKIPFIQKTHRYTSMLLTYDTDASEVTTMDKKKVVLDNFAQWKINNPALFMTKLGTIRSAHKRIDESIYSKMLEEIGKIEAHTLIADKEYVTQMLINVRGFVNEQLVPFGVEVMDIRIKRTDYPEDNYENIFNRMRTDREKVAAKYRSEGQEEAQIIRSQAEREATIIEARAYEEAETIKGLGDAEAVKIYADAYSKDPEFYEFYRTLQAYKETMDKNTVMVIDPDSDFAKYLFGKNQNENSSSSDE